MTCVKQLNDLQLSLLCTRYLAEIGDCFEGIRRRGGGLWRKKRLLELETGAATEAPAQRLSGDVLVEMCLRKETKPRR